MSAASPNRYLDAFQQQVRDSLGQYQGLERILGQAGEPASTAKRVAEDTAFRLGSLWEVFQGRWHVAAIRRAPTAFVRDMQGTLDKEVKGSWARSAIEAFSPGALTVPPNPRLSQIETLLDPDGRNISFRDVAAWKTDSIKHHSQAHKALVIALAGDAEAASFLALLRAMRNNLAHGSRGSLAVFNEACRPMQANPGPGLVGAANQSLRRDQNDVREIGVYLRARQPAPTGRRRLETIHSRLIDVSEMLRTP